MKQDVHRSSQFFGKVLTALGLLGLATAAASGATVIDVNFSGGLPYTGPAAVGLPGDIWNKFATGSASSAPLVDTNGTLTNASLTYSATGVDIAFPPNGFFGGPYNNLMENYLFENPGGIGLLTFDGLNAATIYSTGFEAPTYSIGPLNGQDGWIASGNTNVASVLPQSGNQDAVLLDAGGTQSAAHFDLIGASPVVTVEANLELLSHTTPWSFGFVSAGGANGSVTINTNGSLSFANTGFTTPAGTISLLNYNRYDLTANFGTETYSFALNGSTIAAGIPMGFPFPLPGIFVVGQLVNPVGGLGGEILFDNYSVTTGTSGASTPEPSTLVMFGGGVLMLGIGVMRQRAKEGSTATLRPAGLQTSA